MTVYEVTATVESHLRASYETYIRKQHIPDLLGTGHFTAAFFESSVSGRYRIRYIAETRQALDRYLEDKAAGLRKDFFEHFPTGVELSREEWDVIEAYP
jgi:hypothetical protein